MSIALRNSRKTFVNAMVRVTKQQQRYGIHVAASSVAAIAPGQVFILPFHVGLSEDFYGAAGDMCSELQLEVVLLANHDVEDLKQKQQAKAEESPEKDSDLFWTNLPPPTHAPLWGRVHPPPPVRCRKEKNSSFRFTFMSHDGSAAEAAAVPPRDGTCTAAASAPLSCPIVVSLHGTGVSCNDAADAYKLQQRDGSWLFGIRCEHRNGVRSGA
jgi:hypothetical protein